MEGLVSSNNGKPITDSLRIAQKFGKQHRNVIRAIRDLISDGSILSSPNSSPNREVLSMFQESIYYNEQGKEQPMFIMNRDGFSLLVMGFTGKEALTFKLEFISAFNQLESELKNPLSSMDVLELSIKQLREQDSRLTVVEQRLNTIEETRNQATEELLMIERSTEDIPELTVRAKIRKIVNSYCFAKNTDQRSVWHVIYDRLYYRFGVNLNACIKNKGESTLDLAERLGHIDKIYNIVSKELTA